MTTTNDTPAATATAPLHHIGGDRVPARSGRTLPVEDPSTVVQSLEMAGYSASWITIPRRPHR